MKVAHSSTTSTDAPQYGAPHIPIPHDLPALPGSPLATLRASIDAWDGHIPSARQAAGSYTRASLDDAIRQAAQDEPRIPAFDDAWGRPSAWAAFGDGAA